MSIVFISHALEEALEISDRITILRDGAHIITDDAKTFSRETIIRHMVGRSLTDDLYGRAADSRKLRPAGEKVLSVQNLSMQNFVRNSSFSIFAGQVTGVFGLVGSGRTETARIIAGVAKRDFFHGGDVRLEDKSVRYRTPRAAVRDGVVYVTEDRKGDGSSRRCRSRRTSTSARFRAAVARNRCRARARRERSPPDWTENSISGR